MDASFSVEIEKQLENPHNKKCNDCDNTNPKWISTNNAVFLCIKCAGAHRGLGNNISQVKNIGMDTFTSDEIGLLKKGGNFRFNQLLQIYSISANTPLEIKYQTRAAEYYRSLLLAEFKNLDKQPTMPDEDEGIKLIVTLDKNEGKEKANETGAGSTSEASSQQSSGGLFGSVTGFLSNVKDSALNTAGNLQNKVNELGITEKIRSTGSSIVDYGSSLYTSGKNLTGDAFEKTKNYLYEGTETVNKTFQEKSSAIISSEYVQVPKKYTEEAVLSFKDKASSFLSYFRGEETKPQQAPQDASASPAAQETTQVKAEVDINVDINTSK